MVWAYRTAGIPDNLFERSEEVPITKEEIRALVISKLRLRENSWVIDVGCGSGSITVELCIQVPNGQVFGIDSDEAAIDLTKRNLLKFGMKANLFLGQAQEILPTLPQVDAVIIGGSSGDLTRLADLALSRLKTGGRIVFDTILIETLCLINGLIKKNSLYEIDITQVIVTKSKVISAGTMMVARNPVTIVSAAKP
ncbi:MAG TPA: precorrin-6Y C5,15-methyltransferase (decarboxylating) subunit CbiT [Candidatus Nitrosopolaris sp.]|jgi:cobalt-precorrin-6B (C15)-methyltransferase|nr:precorrin-6Y C5,15-methyltransferase (decarboxylating) subunit CbiT [Candidatus Nitrosopolaris sp.]